MNWVIKNLFRFTANKKTTVLLLSVVFFFVASAVEVSAQKNFSKTYPASKNVSLKLINRTGKVEVEGWDRNEIQISAYLEKPAAYISPQNLSGTIVIDLVKDNQGKHGVGSVNFTIRVPYSSSVNIETSMGNLSISNVRGTLVRAHIYSEGDITLTNISSNYVTAENGIGDIFFDGLIQSGGTYRFTSMNGRINLHIPFNASFKLVATAPSTRSISLGGLSNSGFRFVGQGRRVIGQNGDGSASLTVTNHRGSIAFISR
ncbi:MAG TPA: DUF4097 family beta strand repeat-containing protein [Pyrinomonadaceae bacterium]|nr:DUF4097 family beta strand repeat-containing protein [Pyrinomonadaceae bacterium]